jgi:hypothetical protein
LPELPPDVVVVIGTVVLPLTYVDATCVFAGKFVPVIYINGYMYGAFAEVTVIDVALPENVEASTSSVVLLAILFKY